MATDTAGAPHRLQPRADMVDLEEDDTGVESVATGVPCPLSTSIWRSLATISSGPCFFLRAIERSSSSAEATWGWTTSRGAGHDAEIFYSLQEARIVIEGWRRHHNTRRPHSALAYKAPAPEVALWPAPPAIRTVAPDPVMH
jgi:transposase InsO family protein